MFEKFTERARKVASLARQEAQRLNSDFIGTEHLLLGILSEGGGVACMALKRLGIDSQRLRKAVEGRLQVKTTPSAMLGQIPFTPHCKKVFEVAGEEANKSTRDVVGTEHILLGLYLEKTSVAYEALQELGMREDTLRKVIQEILAQENPGAAGVPSTIAMDKAIEMMAGMMRPRKVKVWLFKEGSDKGVPSLTVEGKAYRVDRIVTLDNCEPEKEVDVVGAIIKAHGASTYLLLRE